MASRQTATPFRYQPFSLHFTDNMVSKSAVFVTLSMLLTIAASRQGLHLATHGLLQIHPSFSNKGVFLYPGHHPDHDSNDLEHLTPKVEQQLHYAQEGHRRKLCF